MADELSDSGQGAGARRGVAEIMRWKAGTPRRGAGSRQCRAKALAGEALEAAPVGVAVVARAQVEHRLEEERRRRHPAGTASLAGGDPPAAGSHLYPCRRRRARARLRRAARLSSCCLSDRRRARAEGCGQRQPCEPRSRAVAARASRRRGGATRRFPSGDADRATRRARAVDRALPLSDGLPADRDGAGPSRPVTRS
jgi:hypothetical protein